MGLFFKSRKHKITSELPEWLAASDGLPFYIKAPMVLIGLYLFFNILNLLQEIMVPFAFAGLIAVLLNPVYNRFQKWNFNKIVAIVLTIFIAIVVVAGIMFFLSSQIAQFGDMVPQLEKKAIKLLDNLQVWLSSSFGISTEKQMSMLDEAINNSRMYVGKTVNTLFGIISFFVLIPLYIFLLLFYKPLILNFIFEVFDENNSEQVAEILQETKGAVQSYIVGLMI